MDALNRMFFRPKRGMYRQFHGVKACLEPKDLLLYRRLLPAPLTMPDLPVVMVFVADYTRIASWFMPSYREAGVLLQSCYRGELGWYTLTMPVTNRFAMWAGRSVGFPKYIADELTLEKHSQSWCGAVRRRGLVLLSFEMWPGTVPPLSPWKQQFLEAETFFQGDIHLLTPPPDRRVSKLHLVHVIPPASSVVLGGARITIGRNEPWAGLLDGNSFIPTVECPAAYCEFAGGMNLVTEPPS